MSHIASQETKAGEPMFADLEALQLAAQMCGGRIIERSTYRWYNTLVGDYALPPGTKKEELGKNAKYVFEIDPANYEKFGVKQQPYDIGLLDDPNNPGCLIPVYDFWMGGYGLDSAVGTPLFHDKNKRQVKMLCPLLKRNYDIACDVLAAKQAGEFLDVLTAKAASEKYPHLIPATTDEETWVSIATGERLNAMVH